MQTAIVAVAGRTCVTGHQLGTAEMVRASHAPLTSLVWPHKPALFVVSIHRGHLSSRSLWHDELFNFEYLGRLQGKGATVRAKQNLDGHATDCANDHGTQTPIRSNHNEVTSALSAVWSGGNPMQLRGTLGDSGSGRS